MTYTPPLGAWLLGRRAVTLGSPGSGSSSRDKTNYLLFFPPSSPPQYPLSFIRLRRAPHQCPPGLKNGAGFASDNFILGGGSRGLLYPGVIKGAAGSYYRVPLRRFALL